MKTSLKLSVPDDAVATITVTATIGQFKRIESILNETRANNYYQPLTEMNDAIHEVIQLATRAFDKEYK